MICYVIKPPGINFFFLSCGSRTYPYPSPTPKFGSYPSHPSVDSSLALFFPLNTLTVVTFPGLAMGNAFLWNPLLLNIFSFWLINSSSFIILQFLFQCKLNLKGTQFIRSCNFWCLLFFITDMTKKEMSSPKCISRFKLQASFAPHI